MDRITHPYIHNSVPYDWDLEGRIGPGSLNDPIDWATTWRACLKKVER